MPKSYEVKNFTVPTGNIYILETEDGPVEFLSVGDYGKEANVKADFLGLTRKIEGVPNTKVMHPYNKWVITISTQHGCDMGCQFCDVPKVGKGTNVSLGNLMLQIKLAVHAWNYVTTKRLNVHFARMGEPTWNYEVIDCGYALAAESKRNQSFGKLYADVIHPVVSTMMPYYNTDLAEFIREWCYLKNHIFEGDAGLQLSINSTNEEQRTYMFSGSAMSLQDVSSIMRWMDDPVGRKYTLNFALADDYEVDAKLLANLFPPERFLVKITPLHRTKACIDNDIKTSMGYEEFTPYEDVENRLKDVGFDVIVFVPSYDEDDGLITCGNAILSGRVPTVPYTATTRVISFNR